MKPRALLPILSGCLVLLGCAAQPVLQVTLLPQFDASGQALQTAVDVQIAQQKMSLQAPYAVARSDATGQLVASQTTQDEVTKRYALLLKVSPPNPLRYVLHFASGVAELTPESEALLPELLRQVALRDGGELVIIGHTDSVGSVAVNDALSKQRAQKIAQYFMSQQFSIERIRVIGRGEREPLIPTDDEVAEPRNRRVDVLIR